MSVFDIFFKIGVNSTPMQSGLRDARKHFHRFGEDIASDLKSTIAGVFAYGTLKTLVFDTVAYADKIGDLASQYSITTDEVQRLMRVTRQNGLEMQDFAKVLDKVGAARRAAVEGGEAGKVPEGVFARYGINKSQLNDASRTDLDIVLQIGQALKGINLDSRERQQLEDIIGIKSGLILSTMQDLAALGPINLVKKEDIKLLSDAKDTLEKLNDQKTIFMAGVIGEAWKNPWKLLLPGSGNIVIQEAIKQFLMDNDTGQSSSDVDEPKKLWEEGSKNKPPPKPPPIQKMPLRPRDPSYNPPSADEWTRVGMFVGAGGGGRLNLVDIASAQLEVQQESERHLSKLSAGAEGSAAYSYPP